MSPGSWQANLNISPNRFFWESYSLFYLESYSLFYLESYSLFYLAMLAAAILFELFRPP